MDEEDDEEVEGFAFVNAPAGLVFTRVQDSIFDREVSTQLKMLHACLMGVNERTEDVERLQAIVEELFWEANISTMMLTSPENARELMLNPMRRTGFILDIQGRASDVRAMAPITPISTTNVMREMGIQL